jgi:hypothetical protein
MLKLRDSGNKVGRAQRLLSGRHQALLPHSDWGVGGLRQHPYLVLVTSVLGQLIVPRRRGVERDLPIILPVGARGVHRLSLQLCDLGAPGVPISHRGGSCGQSAEVAHLAPQGVLRSEGPLWFLSHNYSIHG